MTTTSSTVSTNVKNYFVETGSADEKFKTSMLGGVYTINGTSVDDAIEVRQGADSSQVQIFVNNQMIDTIPYSAIQALKVNGNAGSDQISIGKGLSINATINGGADNDTIYGGDGDDTIDGGDGNDFIDGGAGADNITGGDGNDHINGGAGNDLINGGTGFDPLSGGTSFAPVASKKKPFVPIPNLIFQQIQSTPQATPFSNMLNGVYDPSKTASRTNVPPIKHNYSSGKVKA